MFARLPSHLLPSRLSSPEKRHNNEKPPIEEEKKEKIELKSITSDGETNTATKVRPAEEEIWTRESLT